MAALRALALVVPVLVVVQKVHAFKSVCIEIVRPHLQLGVVGGLVGGIKSVPGALKRVVGGQDTVAIAVCDLDSELRGRVLVWLGEVKEHDRDDESAHAIAGVGA